MLCWDPEGQGAVGEGDLWTASVDAPSTAGSSFPHLLTPFHPRGDITTCPRPPCPGTCRRDRIWGPASTGLPPREQQAHRDSQNTLLGFPSPISLFPLFQRPGQFSSFPCPSPPSIPHQTLAGLAGACPLLCCGNRERGSTSSKRPPQAAGSSENRKPKSQVAFSFQTSHQAPPGHLCHPSVLSI